MACKSMQLTSSTQLAYVAQSGNTPSTHLLHVCHVLCHVGIHLGRDHREQRLLKDAVVAGARGWRWRASRREGRGHDLCMCACEHGCEHERILSKMRWWQVGAEVVCQTQGREGHGLYMPARERIRGSLECKSRRERYEQGKRAGVDCWEE